MRIFVTVCATVPPSTCLRIQNVYFDKSTCELISIARVVPFKTEPEGYCSKLVGFFTCRKPAVYAVRDQIPLELKERVKSLRVIISDSDIELQSYQEIYRDIQPLFKDSEHFRHFSSRPWVYKSDDTEPLVPISISPVGIATAASGHDVVMTSEQFEQANLNWNSHGSVAQATAKLASSLKYASA